MDDVRPFPRRPNAPRPGRDGDNFRRWRTRIIVIAVPVVLVVGALLRFWVDIMWFQELGQRSVLVTRLQWGTAMGVVIGLITFLVLFGNFWLARRVARNDLYVPFLAVPDGDPEAPEQPIVPHYVLRPVLLGIAALVAVFAGLAMSSRWETVLRFMGRSDFGVTDPHFNKDASFYVFTMPLLELIARFLQVLTVGTIIAVGVAYIATGVIRYVPVLRIARPAIVHLSSLIAVFLLVSAFQFRLSIWKLATSTTGVVAGAGWTDTHARIPGYWVMIVASLVLAGLVVWYARREKWRIISGAVVGWVAASILVTGILPALVQAVLVEPNELDREKKVLTNNITNTRKAFDLDAIESKPFRDQAKLTSEQLLETNTDTTDNIRLWSPDILKSVIQQQQSLRRYYTFNDVDVDRYTVDGRYRQVMVAVRELDPSNSTVARSWTNQRLAYTHGFGAVATWPNEVTSQNLPQFLLRDLPPKAVGQDEITLDKPQVYFGEASDNQVFVGTRQDEISPRAETDETAAATDDTGDGAAAGAPKDAKTKYSGTGGVPITSFARRVAFAATFGDARVLFTDQFTGDTRILFRRNVKERITELAPFLTLDNDPYAVIIDGRIKWIVDAYTTSDRFPYSEPITLGGGRDGATSTSVNYVRNSVKAVVDAYDGDVKLYVADDQDPILGAWRDIFPKLFTDMDRMPKDLRAHLRYPEDLFRLQTDRWRRYHMDDVADFYASEDLWEVPTLDGAEMEPFYILAKLPGAKEAEMLLVRPFSPSNRKNMIAYMVAGNDGDNYGRVITFELPTQVQTQGPSQVQALIRQDSDIAERVRLWESGGNEVKFGNLLVLPIESSLLYAQPVYLQNAEAQIPEFQRIVLALGTSVAWGDDFDDAARNLLAKIDDDMAAEGDDADDTEGRDDAPADGDDADADTGSTSSGNAADFEGLSSGELSEVLADVAAAYEAALACQKRGDWACYGRETKKVEQLLDDARAKQ